MSALPPKADIRSHHLDVPANSGYQLITCSFVEGNPNNGDDQKDQHPVLKCHSVDCVLARQKLQGCVHSANLYAPGLLKTHIFRQLKSEFHIDNDARF